MTWMLTATGRKIDIANVMPQDIDILDIAAHLAKIPRFTGACRQAWSVAEHCCLVADILADRYPDDIDLQLCGLLHDAPEYILQDLSTPVKDLVGGLYRPLERSLWWAVAERFGLPMRLPDAVRHADLVALATEKRDLMPPHPEPWSVLEGIEPHPRTTIDVELGWRAAQRLFLEQFHELQAARADARGTA